MTSFFHTTTGQINEFHRLLAQKFGSEDIDRIIKDPSLVAKMYEAICPTWEPPVWWSSYESQMKRARQAFGNIRLPAPPTRFTPRDGTKEVPLLHVPDAFGSLWNKIIPPAGFSKRYLAGGLPVGLIPFIDEASEHKYNGPVWLAFDPENGRGLRVDAFQDRSNLAVSEVLSAMIQFQDWPATWGLGSSSPNIMVYSPVYNGKTESYALRMGMWHVARQLEMTLVRADLPAGDTASPSVQLLN